MRQILSSLTFVLCLGMATFLFISCAQKDELKFEDLSADKSNNVNQKIYNYVCKDSLSMDPPASCYPKITKQIDLNGDGEDEYIISGQDVLLYSGSRGYTSWIFIRMNDKLAVLKDFSGYDVKVLNTRTNGYLDLTQEFRAGFNPDGSFRTLKWFYKWDKEINNYVKVSP